MSLEFLVDENVNFKIISALRKNGYIVLSICESYSGLSDNEVLNLAYKNHQILITEDSDFGELVFSYRSFQAGVIFLRYHFSEIDDIINSLLNVIDKYQDQLYKNFSVITKNKIRIREL
ncbi:MAG: hypothetical protein A2Y33_05385 [Spirochaetes bacterium GWF1_51_8]|nr:MAG: hypothetical protein A2Y33_05385 [Spirochaetes bacterium GWF1_51_8]